MTLEWSPLFLDIIDPAMLRPGRLDKQLYIGLPQAADRSTILNTITKVSTNSVLTMWEVSSPLSLVSVPLAYGKISSYQITSGLGHQSIPSHTTLVSDSG